MKNGKIVIIYKKVLDFFIKDKCVLKKKIYFKVFEFLFILILVYDFFYECIYKYNNIKLIII